MSASDGEDLFGLFEDVQTDVLSEFLSEVDPKLIDLGWGFIPAKCAIDFAEYELTDQSMANHVRSGAFAITRLNTIAPTFGAFELSDTELRQTLALFVIHDLHKLRDDTTVHTEYDIDKATVDTLVTRLGLWEFAPSLRLEDFHACAVDHENSWKSNPEHSTRTYNKLRPFVRVADGFASCATPEEAAGTRNLSNLATAYPGANLELRHHTLDDVKGEFTNILNGVTNMVLAEQNEYELFLIYQDGCVYLTDSDAPDMQLDEPLIGDIYERLKTEINDAHPAYKNREQLAENLATRSQGFYGINNQDFFYAGAPNVLLAISVKAKQDADPTTDPTDSMQETMESLNERLPIEIDTTTRVAPGYARLAYTVKRSYVDPLVDADLADDALTTTCRLFGVDDDVMEGLCALEDDELSLTAGGKWDYSYAIGQHIADLVRRKSWSPAAPNLAGFLAERLNDISEEWNEVVMEEHTGEFETELRAYIADILRIGGRAVDPTEEMEALTDPFEEHHTVRRGKTCTFCNRGTTSTRKDDMKAPKSLTTFQAGYSNRIPADAGKPDNLLVCIPCQVEFSLRETGATRREDGRLFIHLVPDYFYTPAMWSMYANEVFARFTGEAMTRTGRLAEAVFEATKQIDDDFNPLDPNTQELSASLATVLREATRADDSGGRSVVEQLSQGFDVDTGFGTRILSFYKPQDNETEFQFFGVFIGIAVASTIGLRAYISHSPLPDVRGRDFHEMVKLDAGFTTVAEFYGHDIPLKHLSGRLGAAAALVQLGYGLKREDALFPKYLRATRNKPLPGSYLLKRIAQNPDSGGDSEYLLEETNHLDGYMTAKQSVTANNSENDQLMTSNEKDDITTLAELAYDAIRPVYGNKKPHTIERVFRESVKAVKDTKQLRMDTSEAEVRITGRLQKLPKRSDQVYRVPAEQSEHGDYLDERIERYAKAFATRLLADRCEGKPSLLKQRENNFADGFYAATLRLQRESTQENNEDN